MKNKNIILGVSGGIAAYKAAYIASRLVKKGYNVDVIMTENAKQFITPLTFETITKNSVVTDMFEKAQRRDVEHIALAEKADLVLVAPATYNMVGKIANGIADDMLTTVISATKVPVFFALAMNKNMYENPILNDNIEKLKRFGYGFIEADEGMLACNVVGKGRLKEPDEIVDIIDGFLCREKTLSGKKVLITTGRTEEAIDPVRYLSNRSTGKMGYAIAEAALSLGAEVTVVSGVVSVPVPEGIRNIKCITANEMYEQVMNIYKEQDIVIMAAAVADYRPKSYHGQKIKKSDAGLVIELVKNPDILFEAGKIKENQFLAGFAAESENLIENAVEKLRKKNLDLIVANDSSNFAKDTNKIFFIDREENIEEIPEKTKKELGYSILAKIVKTLEKREEK